ncbi:MAG: RagB/SusD family nutrient uptake outer membrane protein [Balneolaceae bacterium]|nr:RagB/SusD family nutrient uptake outer membrane protein [Balneolaceae bacterium]
MYQLKQPKNTGKYTSVSKLFMLLLIVSLTSCQDLSVQNKTAPDRERALSNPGDVEKLIASTFQDYWGRTQTSGTSINTMPLIADEMTGTYANNAALEMSSEPRTPYNNSPTSAAHETGRYQWYAWYAALSSANEGLGAIDEGLEIIDEDDNDNTARAVGFAKFMQGVSLGYLGMIFDQAAITDEHTDLEDPASLEYKPYPQVLDASFAKLESAIDFMENNSFTLPSDWMPGAPLTNDELARVAYSFAARFKVYGARTPEERQAIDWNQVISYVDKGIVDDFNIILEWPDLYSMYLYRAQNSGSYRAHADYKLVGPADTSGAYQDWLNADLNSKEPFLIYTPDRRITAHGDTAETDGKYFRYREEGITKAERGIYHNSYYQWYRRSGNYWEGPHALIQKTEMDLLKAEALVRLGGDANIAEAIDLVNKTRVQNGELKPISASGVPAGSAPVMGDGSPGSLLDAIYYERMIELAGTDALRAYLDRRGSGTLTPGTFYQFPVPGRELQTLGLPIYTFGGGGAGSAE